MITGAGLVVAFAPIIWAALIWSRDEVEGAAWGWIGLFSLVPFLFLAALRASGLLRRSAAAIAAIVTAVIVIDGQRSGLDPGGTSTSAIGFVASPLFAIFLVLFVLIFDKAVAGRRQRESG